MSGDRDRKFQRQWLVTIAILLALGAAVAYDLFKGRRTVEAVEYDRLLVQARAIDENLNRQVLATHQALRRILADLPQWRNGKTYRPLANMMLKTIEEAMPGVRTLVVIDAQGIVRASSRDQLLGRNLSQREYFQTALHSPDPARLYLSPPYTTMLNVYTMNLSVMIPDARGGFNGMVVATLDRDYFKTLLASVQYAPDMWAAVAHGDGIQFLMVPDREGQSGKNLAQPGSFFTLHRDSGRNESIRSGTVYATGEERLMALRSIMPAAIGMDKPLVVAIGRDLGAVFAEWRAETTTNGFAYLLIILATVVSLRYHQARVRRADGESRTAQQALRENEQKYRFLAENTTDVVWRLDLGTKRLTYISPSITRLSGYTPEEIMAQSFEAKLTPGSQHNVQSLIERAMEEFAAGRTDVRQELALVEQPRKDGTTVWTEVAATFVLNEEKRPVEVVGISRDISERRRAEQELRDREEKYKFLVEATATGYVIIDSRGCVVEANREYVRMTGRNRIEDILGKPVTEWTAPHDLARNAAEVAQCMQQGFVRDLIIDYVDTAGRITPVEINATVLRDRQPEQIFTICRDITGRRSMENALRASEERFRNLFEKVHIVSLVIDPEDGSIVNANSAAERYYGWPLEKLKTMKISDINTLPGEAIQKEMELARREQRSHFVFRHRKADGTVRDVEVYSGPLEVRGKALLYSIVHDITERKQAEEQLQRQAAILNLTPAAVMTRDRESRITFWNREAERMYGWTSREALGAVSHELLQTKFPLPLADIEDSIRREEFWEGELVHRKRDGANLTVASRWALRHDAKGNADGYLEVNIDITKRKQAEQELLETTMLVRTFMNAIGESAFLMDREGRILAANETVARRFNKTVREFVGSTIREFLPPAVAASREKYMEEALRTGKMVRFEDERMGRTIDNAIYPVLDSRGEVHALAIVGHDITERKQAAEEREKLIAELQKAIAEIRTLHGILPICSHCKKIRDDKGSWHQMETYIRDHTEAEFSHGLCADCAKKMYPQYFKDEDE